MSCFLFFFSFFSFFDPSPPLNTTLTPPLHTEYISTLEGDIAERDRLLDAIRTELGSSKSENLALRQEIAALKRTLLSGRGLGDGTGAGDVTFTAGGDVNVSMSGIEALNLPPPAPLPEMSAAEVLAASAAAASLSSTTASSPFASTSTYQTPGLLTPNTQKDLPSSLFSSSSSSSSSSGTTKQGFWGGFGGGGVMPVHTALVPDVSVFATKGLENINPAMNGNGGNNNGSRTRERERENVNPLAGKGGALGGFDGFADLNPFTMKTLDAYVFFLLCVVFLLFFFVPLIFVLNPSCFLLSFFFRLCDPLPITI